MSTGLFVLFYIQFIRDRFYVPCRCPASLSARDSPVLLRHVRGPEAACTIWTARFLHRSYTAVLRSEASCGMADFFALHIRLSSAVPTETFHLHEFPYWKSQVHSSGSQTRTGYHRLTASHHNPAHVRHAAFHLQAYHRSASEIHSHIPL